MKDRAYFLRAISKAIEGKPKDAEEQNAVIEALLLTAATIANAMSSNTMGMSSHHVEESATAMIEVLDETFGFSERLSG